MSPASLLRGLFGRADAAPGGGLPPEAVRWAIRLFLGREPLDEGEVELHRAHPSLEALRLALARSAAFRGFYDAEVAGRLAYAAPPWLLAPARAGVPWRLEAPSLARPVSQLCTAEQLEEPAYAAWCAAFGEAPRAHRKQWEFCWVLSVMEAAGLIRPGARMLGFGTGREPIPSVLAARGVEVVASDAPAEIIQGQGWEETGQHSIGLMDLHNPALLPEAAFRARVSFRSVDMNAIAADLAGFDACWSCCALEHLGGIGKGLGFIEASLATLRPGGLAIHTTEFNLSSDEETLEAPTLSLFRRRDIEGLLARLSAAGHEVWPLNLHPGHAPLDAHIDAPPYALPHLKLLAAHYVTTSIGVAIRRAG